MLARTKPLWAEVIVPVEPSQRAPLTPSTSTASVDAPASSGDKSAPLAPDRVAPPPPQIPRMQSKFTTPPAVSDGETASNNAAYAEAIAGGTPVSHNHAEAVGFWMGVSLSAPVDFFVSGQRYMGELLQSAASAIRAHTRKKNHGFGWTLLVPVAALLQFLAQLCVLIGGIVDAPFRMMRNAIRSLAHNFEREKPAPLSEANFLRVHAWPHLPVNAASEAAVARYRAAKRAPYDAIIVPGFADDDQTVCLSDDAKQRLNRAVRDLRAGLAPFILVSGGNVHPEGTPYNEAYEMRRYLIEQHHLSPEQILTEPFAEHTPTNLRNAGRLMRSLGLQRAVITSSMGAEGQMHVFNRADSLLGGDDTRALIDNGTLFGHMAPVDFFHCAFLPDDRVDLVKLENGRPRDETPRPTP